MKTHAKDAMLGMFAGMLVAACGGTDRITATDGTKPDPTTSVSERLEPIAEHQSEPRGIAVDGTSVYWVNRGGDEYGAGSVVKAALDGSAPAALATEQDFPSSLALDADGVAWATYGAAGSGSLVRTSLGGAGLTGLASGLDLTRSTAAAAGRVYWTDVLAGTVSSVKTTGADATTIASEQHGLGDVVTSQERVFWVAGSRVLRADPAGVAVVWEGEAVRAIAADAERIAWITAGGDVMVAPSAGGAVTLLLVGEGSSASDDTAAIAVDASGVYFSESDGTVRSVSLDGNAVELHAADQGQVAAIAVDGTSLYWVDAARGTVMRVAKGRLAP